MAMTRLEAKAHRERTLLRARTTALEETLWRELRLDPGESADFHRQVTIGPYLADFVSHRLRLIVELDGAQHAAPAQRAKDQARDLWLAGLGYLVLRFPNAEVRRDPDAVLDTIRAVVEERRHLPPGDEPERPMAPGKRRPRPKPGTS